MIQTQLEIEGVKVLTGHRAEAVDLAVEESDDHALICVDTAGNETRIEFDQLLVAVGRKAKVTGFGLEKLGVQISDGGTVEVTGKAEQVVVLPALLEALPEVEHAALRGAIRKDKITGLIPFHLRIVLNQGAVEQ